MSEPDKPDERSSDGNAEKDDLLEGARALEAEEQALEEETQELERLEQEPKEWLREQPRFHWPVEEESGSGSSESDEAV